MPVKEQHMILVCPSSPSSKLAGEISSSISDALLRGYRCVAASLVKKSTEPEHARESALKDRQMARNFPKYSRAAACSSGRNHIRVGHKLSACPEKRANTWGTMRAKGKLLSVRKRPIPWEKTNSLGEVKNHKTLLDNRRALRPLLNALRFVESSNRVHCPDADNGNSVGPLQISKQYHLDAWIHKKSISWSRCRDLEHAENTVVAYWPKYCSDALIKHDWEILAKTHNGGPEGPAREKTVYYWNKVLHHLQQPESIDIITSERNGAPQSPRRCLAINMDSRTDVMKGSIMPVKERGIAVVAKSEKPELRAITNKMHRTYTPQQHGKLRKSLRGRFLMVEASPRPPPSRPPYKQPSPYVYHKLQRRMYRHLPDEARSDHVSLQNALHYGYWSFPRSAKRQKAATVLQAFWRMHSTRSRYQRLQRGARVLQRQWRKYRRLKGQLPASRSPGFTIWMNGQVNVLDLPIRKTKESVNTDEYELNREDLVDVPGSAVDTLYDANTSASKEEEILNELASFFPSFEDGSGFPSMLNGCTEISAEQQCLDPQVQDSERLLPPFSPSMKGWTDMCSLDSPTSSPGGELTFANLSNDKSLPPTPIKQWSASKQNFFTTPPSLSPVCTALDKDKIKYPHSPTKDWTSPSTEQAKSPIPTICDVEDHIEEVGLPKEWILNQGLPDLPNNWYTAYVPYLQRPRSLLKEKKHLSSCLSVNEAPDLRPDVIEHLPLAMLNTSVEDARLKLPCHKTGPILHADISYTETTPISSKRSCLTSSTSVDLTAGKVKKLPPEDADGLDLMHPSGTPSSTGTTSTESPLSLAMEEELLDELVKLFQAGHYPAVPAGPLHSADGSLSDSQEQASGKSFEGKSQSRVYGQTLGSERAEDFMSFENSARKNHFDSYHGYGPQEIVGQRSSDGCVGTAIDETSVKRTGVQPQGDCSGSIMTQLVSSEIQSATMDPSTSALQIANQVYPDQKVLKEEADMRVLGSSEQSQILITSNLRTEYQEMVPGLSKGFSSVLKDCPEDSWTSSKALGQGHQWAEGGICKKASEEYRGVVGTFGQLPKFKTSEIITEPNDDREEQVDGELPALIRRESVLSPDFRQCSSRLKFTSYECDNEQLHCFTDFKPEGIRKGKTKPQPSTRRQISFDQLDLRLYPAPCISISEGLPDAGNGNEVERLLRNVSTSSFSRDNVCVGMNPTHAISASMPKRSPVQSMSVSRKYFLQSPCTDTSITGFESDSIASMASDFPDSADLNSPTKFSKACLSGEESLVPQLDEDNFIDSPSSTQWEERWVDKSFETLLEHRDVRRFWSPENFSGPLLLTSGMQCNSNLGRATSSACILECGIRLAVGHPVPSLQDLCKIWDEDCVDLLTRSLNYKRFMADSELLSHEVRLAYEEPHHQGPQTIAWEIQNVERLLERLEKRETLKELVKQQRDTIYINIATNASRRERYQLYNRWGIRRLSTGRLRKVIYELLWKHPKRYYASAELVLQYL